MSTSQFSVYAKSTPMSRRTLLSALMMTSAAWVCLTANVSHAAPVDEAVVNLQHDWEVIRYQAPSGERAKRFENLVLKAHQVSEANPNRAEPLIWEGIIVSSLAAEKGGLGALGLAKQAKTLYETAISINGDALEGSAYNSLGVLYSKVPGWPVGFGDKNKAKEFLQKALAINPKGIDPNFFYGEFLLDTKQPEQAAIYLERAMQSPARPGRSIADLGRREEVKALLEKTKTR